MPTIGIVPAHHTPIAKMNLLLENLPLIRSLTLDMSYLDMLDVPFSNLARLHLNCNNFYGIVAAEKQPPKAMILLCRNHRLQELRITRAWLLLQHFNSSALQFLRSSCLRSLDIEGLEYISLTIIQAILGHCPDTLQELRLIATDSSFWHDENAEYPRPPGDLAIVVPRVHPSLRVLTLKYPRADEQQAIFLCDLIQSSPRLQEFTFYSLNLTQCNIITCLTKSCTALNSIDFTHTRISEADMLHFIALCPPLRSLAMYLQPDHHKSVIPSLLSRFGSILQELRIHGRDLPPSNDHGFIALVLAHCSCLKTLSIDLDHNRGVVLQDLLAVEWATSSLENLCLAIGAPDVEVELDRLLQEWRQHRCIYLYPGEYGPEGPIARASTYVGQLLQFYKRLQAQPRLTNLQLKWRRGWFSIPHEFAEVFTGGELTEKKLSWMMLNLNPLYTADKIVRSAARKKEEEKKERAIKDKLDSCNIFVVHVESPRKEADDDDSDDNKVVEDPSWLPDDDDDDDQEYSIYKSRKARTRSTPRRK
ncbi:hypothetical protein BGW39_002318 [Mortierella sp. 14UC]|nr:hypothetical protein BGW39_002318 [Mortierella sp. 14UC]